jgi:hypothetical protein
MYYWKPTATRYHITEPLDRHTTFNLYIQNESIHSHVIISLAWIIQLLFQSFLEQSITQAVVHRLDLGVVVQGVRSKLTAETGGLVATEGSLVGDQVVAVDPDGTA